MTPRRGPPWTGWPDCSGSVDRVIELHAPLRAVLFDAGNTLLFLDYARIASAVGAALGLPLTGGGLAAGAPAAARAMEDSRGTDRERATVYLETLFLEAGVPPADMPDVREQLATLHGERHLWSGIADDAHEALGRLRRAGLRLGIVSNSDGRVDEALVAAGLRPYFEVVVDSTLAGVEKPDPAIFRAALDVLEVAPEQALYVGDLYEVDVIGANAAGIPAVLLVPPGAPRPQGCATTGSLRTLADDLLKETPAS
jgi:putative hydrolase of the HAD superfamily